MLNVSRQHPLPRLPATAGALLLSLLATLVSCAGMTPDHSSPLPNGFFLENNAVGAAAIMPDPDGRYTKKAADELVATLRPIVLDPSDTDIVSFLPDITMATTW